MMKYRAWNKQKKEWFDLERDYYGLDFEGNLINYYTSCGELMDDSEDYAEVTFSTGLMDKNGTEIYEGDILYAFGNVDGEQFIGVVEWDSDNARFKTSGFQHLTNESCFVKGNIYEHIELLEGQSCT